MSRDTKPYYRRSYAASDPELRKGMPESLRNASPVRSPFDHARDPLISAQLRDMEKTEAQRREESGRGSLMVKMDKPFPDLRPKHEREPLRQSFNQAWLREQRAARMEQYKAEEAAIAREKAELSQEQRPGVVKEWTL